jgi:hypothetical protein
VDYVTSLGIMCHDNLLSWLGVRGTKAILWPKLRYHHLFNSFHIFYVYTLYTCID